MNIFKSILTILILFCFITDTNAGDIVGKVKYDGKPPKKRPLRMDADPVCGSSHSGKVFSESFKVNSDGELAESIVYLRKVKYDGKPPKKRPLRMDADPVCGSSHSGKVFSESFKVNSNGELAESIVYLRNVKYNGSIPKEVVELDQKGCIYTPHVFGIQAGQELLIKNSDATLHNIHSIPKKNKEFNFAMPKVVKQKKAKFDKSEDPFYIKCDVHPWMKTWVLVSDHPYYSVTDKNGNYQIKNVPAGTYEVVCWQEKFKKKAIVDKVTVGSGSVTKDFTFSRPKKK
jgi:plastocyanin